MPKRLLVLLGLALLVSSMTSCVPPWRLIRQAVPRPYPPNARFVIMPISFRGVSIDNMSKREYLSRKNLTDRHKWTEIFTRMRHEFANTMMDTARNARLRKGARRQGKEIAILPIAESIEGGFYGGLINRNSLLQLRIEIRVGRRVFDEFRVAHSTRPNQGLLPRFPSIASRMKRDAIFAGRYAGMYLRKRLSQPD